jgi:hypothetical protein
MPPTSSWRSYQSKGMPSASSARGALGCPQGAAGELPVRGGHLLSIARPATGIIIMRAQDHV